MAPPPVIRPCGPGDRAAMAEIINDAARAYRGVIPADRWREPYMGSEELDAEIAAGVTFHGRETAGGLVAVMGIQTVDDVILIRHAYVRTAEHRRGHGTALLRHLVAGADRPVLVGTWAAADWAIRFYRKHGFRRVTAREKDRLLRRYWNIPARQIETSVVLADRRWFARADGRPGGARPATR